MKNFLLSFSCATALITAVFFGAALAQGPPPAAAPGSQSEQDDWPSLADRSVRESFTSSGGLFTIKLPKQLSGFDAITPADAGMNISGSTFHFTFREGTVAISFWDYLDPGFDLKTEKDFADFFAQMKQVPVTRMRAVLVSERPVSLGSYRGRHFVYDLRDGKREILRVYYVNKRAYTLQAVTENKASSAEALITAAYDSFALVSQATIDAERAKTIKSSTPAPLPQIGKRKQTSDAQDDHLKGKVKTVSAEDQDLSGTWAGQTRHLSSINDFDAQGYRLKSIDFGERRRSVSDYRLWIY